MKTLRSALMLGFGLIVSSLTAQITPNGYVSSSNIPIGGSTTFVRDGSTTNAFAWTEAVLWNPDSSYTNLGNNYSGLPYSQSVTPTKGVGTYWIQYRLVDEFYNYEDQWISFTVYQPNRAPTVYGNVYQMYSDSGGTYYQLEMDAYDADGNLAQGYITTGWEYNVPLTNPYAGGSYDYKNYSYFYVPSNTWTYFYFVAVDSNNYMNYDMKAVYTW